MYKKIKKKIVLIEDDVTRSESKHLVSSKLENQLPSNRNPGQQNLTDHPARFKIDSAGKPRLDII